MNVQPANTLLMVEDDPALRQMLTWELEELGYQVTAVSCCAQAREQLESSGFDLALLDYCLPDGNGLELLDNIRDKSPGTQVVLCSALACRETREQALDQGAALFLTKPMPIHLLDRLFRQTLNANGT